MSIGEGNNESFDGMTDFRLASARYSRARPVMIARLSATSPAILHLNR